MTFLELVQALHRESGAGGPPPSTVVNQIGEANRLVNWVRDADEQIQERWHDWRFLWSDDFSATTTAGTATISVPDTVADWDRDTFKINGDQKMVVEDYFDVRGSIFYTDQQMQPYRVIIRPDDNNLQLDPVPDDAYTITADYYRKPVKLQNDSDVSRIPERFHRAIIGQALLFYGSYENSEDVVANAKFILEDMMKALEANQRPKSRENLLGAGSLIQVRTPR